MNNAELIYIYKGKEYRVIVSKRRQRNIYYRFRNDSFLVTCPYLTSQKIIMQGLDKYAGKLIDQYVKRNSHYSFEDDYVYILGEKVSLSSLYIINKDELTKYLKKNALQKLTEIVRGYETLMGINEPYKVAIRTTKAQFGSNSLKTRKLSFQLDLIHFSSEIIESVVVHELAHDFYRNHQKEFYNVVYKYCPNYDYLQKKLKKGIHQ